MKIYIKKQEGYGAWYWIYNGYQAAWERKGYEVVRYNSLNEINTNEKYDLMVYDIEIVNTNNLKVLENANRAYMFISPNKFVHPWGLHPNWLTPLSDETIKIVNSLDNVHLWAFIHADRYDYFYKWKKINRVSMAFDNINYLNENLEDDKYKYDICFVGSWANNGYDEKRKIMIDHFLKFKKMDIKCGIFVHQGIKNLSLKKESKILFNTKIPINLHDNYQRILGLEHNERTYKSLGVNGFVVSDETNIMKEEFSHVPMAKTSDDMVKLLEKYLNEDLSKLKQQNRDAILKDHTYKSRVEQLLSF
jgi:hypothetical protein